MAVIQVKKWKYLKDKNLGEKIQIQKSKDEWDKETCKGTKTWFFSVRYTINNITKSYKSRQFALKREAEEDERLFLTNPMDYINKHSKRAKKVLEFECNKELKVLDDYLNDFFNYDLKNNKETTPYSHKTRYIKHVSPILGKENPNNIKLKDISNFHDKILEKNLSHNTNTGIHSALSTFLDYLVIKGIIEINYAKVHGTFKKINDEVIDIDKKLKYQTEGEFNTFMSYVEDIKWQAFFNFLFWHGLRKGEQQAIQWKDVDFEKGLVVINKTVSRNKDGGEKITNTKNRRTRIIHLAEQSKNILQNYFAFCNCLPEFNKKWYIFGDYKWCPRTNIKRKLDNTYDEMCIDYPKTKKLTHHEFGRHSHASHLLNKGLGRQDIYMIIAIRLGDSEEVIRKTYAHPYEDVNNDKTKELLSI